VHSTHLRSHLSSSKANLATGAVNLTMRTIYASAPTASAVLCVYMGAVSLVATLLAHANIRIKL
jgi:hypothetical protein